MEEEFPLRFLTDFALTQYSQKSGRKEEGQRVDKEKENLDNQVEIYENTKDLKN